MLSAQNAVMCKLQPVTYGPVWPYGGVSLVMDADGNGAIGMASVYRSSPFEIVVSLILGEPVVVSLYIF